MATSSTRGFIDFEIVGDHNGVQQMLEAVDSALSPIGMASFLGLSVGPWVKERAASRFKSEGDDVTGKWAPLQQSTVEIREKLGFGGPHPINKRTGELEDYITNGQVEIFTSPGMSRLKFPKDQPRSRAMREKLSTAQRGRKTPATVARPVLGMNERDLQQVLVMLAFHVQRTGVTRNAVRG